MPDLSVFKGSVIHMPKSLGRGISIDPENSLFAVMGRTGPTNVFRFDDLVAVDVVQNDSSRQVTNRKSQALGVAVGGVLLGPAGMLIGGLSGSKRIDTKVTKLALKITTNHLHTPVIEIPFFLDPSGQKIDSDEVRLATLALEQWVGRFQAILAARTAKAPLPEPIAESLPPPTATRRSESFEQWSKRTSGADQQPISTGNERYRIRLLGCGYRRPNVIAAVRKILPLALSEAATVVDSAPLILVEGINSEEAETMLGWLKEAGGTARRELMSKHQSALPPSVEAALQKPK
jgi:hypothetical protein